MIRISRKNLMPMLVLLGLTSVPVLVHSYFGFRADDCDGPEALFADCLSHSENDELRQDWMRENFAAEAWCEGIIPTDVPGLSLDILVVRSYDPKKLYHNPEIALLRGQTPDRREVERLAAGNGDVPIHRPHYDRFNGEVFAAYLLVYGSRPVANPYTAQLRSFFPQLVRGRRPMTLYFVSGQGSRGAMSAMESAGKRWLLRSWGQYPSACMGANP